MENSKTWCHDAPLVIAHRGASSCSPENTMAAFRTAVTLGADGIEVDVKLSRDGVPVIHHDLTVDRTTNGTGEVKDLMLSELKKLDAGSTYSSEFSGERIPTLLELIEFAGDNILLNLELTNYNSPFDRLPQKVMQTLKDANLSESILISSFNPINLYRIKRANPNMRIGLLLGGVFPRWMNGPLMKLTPHHDLHPHHSLIDETMIRDTHAKVGRVNAWTVNKVDQMLDLLSKGVDGLITDDVEIAIKTRDVYLNL